LFPGPDIKTICHISIGKGSKRGSAGLSSRKPLASKNPGIFHEAIRYSSCLSHICHTTTNDNAMPKSYRERSSSMTRSSHRFIWYFAMPSSAIAEVTNRHVEPSLGNMEAKEAAKKPLH